MLLPRRKFLRSGLVFGAAAVLLSNNPTSGFASTLTNDGQLSDEVLQDPMYRFTRETFEPYVGGYFEAPDARGKMVALKLVKIDSYDSKTETRTGAGTEAFSLRFEAEAPLPLYTSIHTIKHGALGEFRLFLTRRNGPNGEISYEAVFNHLR